MLPLEDLVTSIVSQYDEINAICAGQLIFAIKTPFCIWPREFIRKLVERKQLRASCQFQHRSGIIFDPKGQVMACNSMADFPMGEIDKDYSDAESLIRLFNSEEVVQSCDHINSYPSERCIGCSQLSLCRGGCPLMWTVYNAKESIPGW
jgi:radical SAM protein with 4Fe4S-binding SPASM domain